MTRPEAIKTLRDWVNRWPKADNLEFDADTREPTVYMAAKRGDPARTKASTIPWKREGDVMTILATPHLFSEGAVAAARKRYSDEQAATAGILEPKLAELRERERALLETWRTYRATDPSGRAALRRTVLAAEKSYMELEKEIATLQNRSTSTLADDHGVIYRELLPQASRVLKMADFTGSG